jgi:hypothetical protein
MKTRNYPTSWKRQNRFLEKLKTYSKNMLNWKLTMIWNVSKFIWNEWCKTTPKWRSLVSNNEISSLVWNKPIKSSKNNRVWRGKT